MRSLPFLCAALGIVLCTACGNTASKGNQSSDRSTSSADNAVGTTANRDLVLTWDARSGTVADSFNVYGSAAANDAEVPLQQLLATAAGFSATAPSTTLHLSDAALQPFIGKQICLAVTAVVAGLESAPSNVACLSL